MPRPSKANSFCCVCKASFEDYLTHVNMPEHHRLMVQSAYCAEIQLLCSKLNPSQVDRAVEAKKSKKIRKWTKKGKASVKVEAMTSTSIETSNSF